MVVCYEPVPSMTSNRSRAPRPGRADQHQLTHMPARVIQCRVAVALQARSPTPGATASRYPPAGVAAAVRITGAQRRLARQPPPPAMARCHGAPLHAAQPSEGPIRVRVTSISPRLVIPSTWHDARITFQGFAQTHQHPVAVIPRAHLQGIDHDRARRCCAGAVAARWRAWPWNSRHAVSAPGLADYRTGRVDVDDA